ncbi:YciI family protein [uncultured Erythrobacter sp.]|uniref:YciI family protein n=1 Tax=uncultured Erythrobacter sp. TaxID=263913 RepID=UPI0026591108|nr:YciI family protein [uncultured Erythrobacter sp.]
MASIFIASLTYTVPIEQVDAVLADHLAWLKSGHDAGHFLAWGPREPRDGGLIFVKAASRAEAEALLMSDPFMLHQLADLAITQWTPRFVGPGLDAFNA